MTEFFDLVGTEKRRYYPCRLCPYILTTESSENKCEKCFGNLVRCTCELKATICCSFVIINGDKKSVCPHIREDEVSLRFIFDITPVY